MRKKLLDNGIEVVLFDKEERYVKDFLELPGALYTKQNIMQNAAEEQKLLLSEHLLSKYFNLHKILVYDGGVLAARGILTLYPKDDCGYLGFFESKEGDYAKFLFESAEKICKEKGIKKIVGPVNCSFWITYRQKSNRFDQRPYTSEPYNLPYYKELWLKNGFKISGRWISNYYDKLAKDYTNEKYKNRFNAFLDQGYDIISPKRKDFDKCMNEVYDLIMELYSDFPIFKRIERDDFMEHFSGFRYIVDFSMVKMAYFHGKAVGFFIGIPDYSNALYSKMTLPLMLKVLLKRVCSRKYVMLYMGVKKEHKGLGNAITQTIIESVKRKRAHCYGAFIKEGKITQNYVQDRIMNKFEYLLYEKEIQ